MIQLSIIILIAYFEIGKILGVTEKNKKLGQMIEVFEVLLLILFIASFFIPTYI